MFGFDPSSHWQEDEAGNSVFLIAPASDISQAWLRSVLRKVFFFLQMAQANAVKQSSGTAPIFIPVSVYISESVSKATGMSCVYESQAVLPFLPRHARSGHRGLQLAPAHVF